MTGKPGFIGIGGQKCATTWIFRNLQDHPQAALSPRKELHFFSATFDRGYRWYEAQFPARPMAKVAGEVSTSYLCSADAPRRAARYNPDFKLVLALRDPVDRAFSNHLHEVRAGHIQSDLFAFEDAEALNPMYLEQGRYASHLRRWLEYFPREHLIVLFQEDIEQQPEAQARALYEFLGIDPGYRSPYLSERVNASATDRSPAAKRLLQAGARMIRGVFGERFMRELRALGPMRKVREANQQTLSEVVPPMRSETRRRLIAEFATDMHDLAALIGRADLPWPSWREACR
jgi:hypothetical protein